MPIDTNLNQTPFFDDFDESKNYHRVLFRPAVPVQARELTQLQTILQNQIERFGDHLFIEGTIVKGCSFFLDREYYYAKILDLNSDGIDVNMVSYANTLAVSESTGLQAVVVDFQYGLQSSTTGEYNTLYFKYLNVGSGDEFQFSNNSTLTLFDRQRTVERVDVVEAGSGYSNGDVVTFSGSGGSSAAAYVVTHANAAIKEVIVTNKGSGYVTAPSANVTSNTGVGAVLSVRHYIDQVFIPSNTHSEYVGTPVGKGYAFKISDGVIYQKGSFVRVDPQSIIVSKYNTSPTDVVVGFNTVEAVVNNSVDSTLNDNASGFTNANAPGAFRLKLTPRLVKLTRAEAAANTEFFTLIEFENGQPVRQRQVAAYSELSKEFARRTYEESGNYVVRKFNVFTEDNTTDSSKLNAVVGQGLGYVNGYRVELFDNVRVPFNKATTITTAEDVNVTTNFGSYVVVNQFKGVFDLTSPVQVSLRDTAGTDVSDSIGSVPSNPGAEIGTAYVRGMEYISGTHGTPEARYNLYLFNIKMNAGKVFDSVRSITINGVAIADAVLETSPSSGSSIAVLKEATYGAGVFSTGVFASKNVLNDQFIFRTDTSTTFSVGGTGPIDISAAYDLPYTLGSVLNATQEQDFIVVATQQALTTARTGTVAATSGANTLTGSGTAFLSQYVEGDYISVNGQLNLITKIANNTSLSVLTNWSTSPAANAHYRAFPNNTPISFSRTASTITIDAVDQNKAVLSLGETLQSSMTAVVITNAKAANFKRTKTINKSVFVKIANTALAASPNGPWNIGLPDVHKLVAVYKTSNNSTYDTAVNVTSNFVLDNGQRDAHYGLASISKAPGSALAIDGTTHLVVEVDAFTHSASGGYFIVDSYPTSNNVPVESDKIAWADLPSYVSSTGTVFELRDALDTRVVASNTVVVTSTLASATVASQTATDTFTSVCFPVPNQIFSADVSKFLPRQDLVVIDTYGSVSVVEGQPSSIPASPQAPVGTITLAKLNVPPFPTLSSSATAYKLPKYTTTLATSQNRRYTMKDIEVIDKKITQLQYYSLLSTLEKDTKNINLPSEANTAIERFKNGFIVDPLTDYSLVDLTSAEYKASINPGRGEATPTFEQNKFDLTVTSHIGTTKTGDAVLLNYTPRVLIEQPIATKVRNPVEALWSFQGAMYINPTYDNFVSTTSSPAVIDFTAWQRGLINAINDAFLYLPINQSTSTTTSTTATGAAWWNPNSAADGHAGALNQQMLTTTTTTQAANYIQINPGAGGVTTANVGNFVTDINLNPYMKGREITVYAVGLRPGAKHYVYFDSKDVNQYVAPAKLSSAYTGGQVTKNDLVITGLKGTQLVADATGTIAAIFYLPDNTFFVGERELIVTDVNDYASLSSATSKASTKYNAFNLDVAKSNVTTQSLNVNGAGATITNVTHVFTQNSEWTRIWDPLAQSFLVSNEIARQGEGLYLTDVDLYFKQKDQNLGVIVEVRTVELGVPTQNKVASKRIAATAVNVSNNAATATKVTFDTPVFLKAGLEYAVVVIPEANSPEYLIWTGEAGGTDVFNPSRVKNQDWNQGAMFISTNGSTWTAYQKEDIKFSLYFAEFNTTSGSVKLSNDDREFLTLSSVSGSFVIGEDVAVKSNNYVSKTFTTSTTNNVITASASVSSEVIAGNKLLLVHDSGSVTTPSAQTVATSDVTLTGTGTTFSTYVVAGDYIVVGNTNPVVRKVLSIDNNTSLTVDTPFSDTASGLAFHKLVPNYDVATVLSVSSAQVTLSKYPKFSSNATNVVFVEKVVSGAVDYVSANGSVVYVKESTANTSYLFAAGKQMIGALSNTQATVGSVDDVGMSHFETLITSIAQPGTTITATANVMNSSNTMVSGSYYLNDTNVLPFDGKVRSRSNEIVYGVGAKSFDMTINFSTEASTLSPMIDVNPASILRYKYLVNNDTTNEIKSYGNAAAKYVSKKVVLADGQEAEDLKVFLTAYKPVGTDVLVYARILNETDGNLFDSKDWTLLRQTSADVYSSSSNLSDFREYEYTFSAEPPATVINNRVVTSGTPSVANNILATVVDFSSATTPTVAANDSIVVVNPADQLAYVRTVSSINSTAITLSSGLNFSNTGVVVKKITQPNAAFKNYENSGIVRYFNNNLGVYDGYKVVAVKVVFVSSNYSRVPRLGDVRAIACSV